MKLLYFFLFVFAALIAGYLLVYDFSFDNETFSNYLINTLFILVLASASVFALIYFISQKRRSANKGIMTIRQYYQYKSAR